MSTGFHHLRRGTDRGAPRSYEREDFIANPLHYLALLEQKPRVPLIERRKAVVPLECWPNRCIAFAG
jgi:hypothetical protein